MAPLAEEQMLKLMVDTHEARFDGRIWEAFDDVVVPELPGEPSMADLGCGPGLFLFDIHQRLPEATLYGFDTSAVMLDVAGNLSWSALKPHLSRCDVSKGIPLPDGGVHFISMNFFLHQFDYPLPILAEALRALKPGGWLWIYDWARRPLEEYLRFWDVDPGLPEMGDPALAYRLFACHNRFTRQDWHYVFSQAGLETAREVERARGQHLLMIVRRAGAHEPAGGQDKAG